MPHVPEGEIEELLKEYESKHGDLSDKDSSEFSEETLEFLYEEVRKGIANQQETIQHYQDIGFRLARTTLIVIGIIVSGIAALLNQDMIALDSVSSNVKVQIGVVALAATTFIAPVLVLFTDYWLRVFAPDRSETALSMKDGEETDISNFSQKELLLKLTEYSRKERKSNTTSIKFLQLINLLSIYVLSGGVVSIILGVLEQL